MSRTLVKGGCVLSMDRKVGSHREADVLIEDGRIAEVGSGLRARDAEVVDAAGSIVLPGFIDTHRHGWHSLLRGHTHESASPAQIARQLTSDDVYAATLASMLGAAAAGVTTVADWVDVSRDHLEAARQAHADSGLRTVFVHAPQADTDPGEWGDQLRGSDGGDATTRAVAVPEPTSTGDGRWPDAWEAARLTGLRRHVHIGLEGPGRGKVVDLAARGLLGPDVTLVHCSGLEQADFDAIASSGASVSLAPAGEMSDGRPAPPMQELIDRDLRPGLGVDSERVAPGDMFAAMRAAISIQHATYFDLKLAGKGGLPNLLTTREVIRYATVDGARALGLEGVTGALAPGMAADLIVLRADSPNVVPVNDPVGAVVWAMDTSNVDCVFAGGQALVRAGELTADVGAARDLILAARGRVDAAAGIPAWAGSGVAS